MTKTTASLETFDFLELLRMLSEQGRLGVLSVYRPDGTFQAWLEGGLVSHLQFGDALGTAALVRLMQDPVGRFHFDEGVTHPAPRLNARLDEVVLELLDTLAPPELDFEGPARLTSRERAGALRWSLRDQATLQQIEAQRPVADIARDPHAALLLRKLARIGLIGPRKSRVARLTVTVTREVRGVVLIDEAIFRRWKEDIVRHPQTVALRTDSGEVYTLPVRSGFNLAALLLVPPELLMRTGLRAGESVLARPV